MKLLWLTAFALFALPPAPAAADETERFNKEVVARFVARINSSEDAGEVATHVAPAVIQHDPEVAPGRAGTAAWIRALRARVPAETTTVRHLLADGDLVLVHSHVSATPQDEMSGTNRYDFYRLDLGVIVEHWVVKAPVPARSVSGNSVFSDLYPSPATEADADLNRLLVKTLSEEVFGERNFGLLERFWAPGYIQHNPYVATGRAALAEVIGKIAPPGISYRVVRSMAEGDLAVTCAHYVAPGGDARNEFAGVAVCDMYRVANLELVEHWDVSQRVPASSVNGNSMFSSLYRTKR